MVAISALFRLVPGLKCTMSMGGGGGGGGGGGIPSPFKSAQVLGGHKHQQKGMHPFNNTSFSSVSIGTVSWLVGGGIRYETLLCVQQSCIPGPLQAGSCIKVLPKIDYWACIYFYKGGGGGGGRDHLFSSTKRDNNHAQ